MCRTWMERAPSAWAVSQIHQGAQEWSCHFSCCPQALFVDRNFLGAELFGVLLSFVASLHTGLLPAEPCVGCLDFLSSSPSPGVSQALVPIPDFRAVLPSQIFLATPSLHPLQLLKKWDSFIYFKAREIIFSWAFFPSRAGWNRSVKPSCSQPSLGSWREPRYIFAVTPSR